MKKIKTALPEIKLVGITTRTNNAHQFASDPSTNKIAATVQKYFHNGLAEKIKAKKNKNSIKIEFNSQEDIDKISSYFKIQKKKKIHILNHFNINL